MKILNRRFRTYGIMLALLIASFVMDRISCAGPEDSFSEEMIIKELSDGNVYSHFQFTTFLNSSVNSEDFHHLKTFPKAIGEILHKFRVQELHLSMTQGYWRHDKWGYPLIDAPPGAELWTWFKESASNVDDMWNGLTQSLAGQFCTSINFMDSKSVITPRWSFRPAGIVSSDYNKRFSQHVRYALLSREVVCTENLTPWKKLLPCGSQSGLATLLNAIQLYSTAYHSLGIHFRPACKKSLLLSGMYKDGQCSDAEAGLELTLTLSVVFDSQVSRITTPSGLDWSLKKLFGRMVTSQCELASVSSLYVDISNKQTKGTLTPQPTAIIRSDTLQSDSDHQKFSVVEDLSTCGNGETSCLAVYDIQQIIDGTRYLNVALKRERASHVSSANSPLLTVTQFLTGSGRYRGGIMCLLHNNADTDLLVTYQATLPWYLRLYLHTLHIDYFNKTTHSDTTIPSSVKVSTDSLEVAELKPALLHYVPGKDRQKSYQLELVVRLPPRSVMRLSYQFEQSLLRWVEYPPDANHGFYIPSAAVSARLFPKLSEALLLHERYAEVMSAPEFAQLSVKNVEPKSNISVNKTNPITASRDAYISVKASVRSRFVRVYSECLLITLPTPDFSMPYNVICLACTVMAILFGSIHNLTTRKFVAIDLSKRKGLITNIKEKLLILKSKLFKAKAKSE